MCLLFLVQLYLDGFLNYLARKLMLIVIFCFKVV